VLAFVGLFGAMLAPEPLGFTSRACACGGGDGGGGDSGDGGGGGGDGTGSPTDPSITPRGFEADSGVSIQWTGDTSSGPSSFFRPSIVPRPPLSWWSWFSGPRPAYGRIRGSAWGEGSWVSGPRPAYGRIRGDLRPTRSFFAGNVPAYGNMKGASWVPSWVSFFEQ